MRYGGTTDLVTDVDPAKTYAVRKPTAHPIYEHWRVNESGAAELGGSGGADAAPARSAS